MDVNESPPVCLDDLSPMIAGADLYGKYLLCRACYKPYRVPDVFSVHEWQLAYDVDNPPSEKEKARRRVKELIEMYKKIGQEYPPVKLAELIPDLELLVGEDM